MTSHVFRSECHGLARFPLLTAPRIKILTLLSDTKSSLLRFGGDFLKICRPSALPHEDARSRWEGAPVTPLSRPRGNRTKLVEMPLDRRRIRNVENGKRWKWMLMIAGGASDLRMNDFMGMKEVMSEWRRRRWMKMNDSRIWINLAEDKYWKCFFSISVLYFRYWYPFAF